MKYRSNHIRRSTYLFEDQVSDESLDMKRLKALKARRPGVYTSASIVSENVGDNRGGLVHADK